MKYMKVKERRKSRIKQRGKAETKKKERRQNQ